MVKVHVIPLPFSEDEDLPASQIEDPAAAQSSNSDSGSTSGRSMDLVCPICFHDYDRDNRCPRMLECLHCFCTECLQGIQLSTCESVDPSSSLAIPCPLCRHLTRLETGDAHALPCNSGILSRLTQVDFQTPAAIDASRLAMVRYAFCEIGNALTLPCNSRILSRLTQVDVLPTVSERVQQVHPDRPSEAAPSLVREQEVQLEINTCLLIIVCSILCAILLIVLNIWIKCERYRANVTVLNLA